MNGQSSAPPRDARANWHGRVGFGLHYDLHATADDTELGRDVSPEHLRETWQLIRPDWVQCDCKGHPGYTSWPTRVGYASPGIVRDALRIHRDVTRELGIPLVMHYSGIWDAAAVQHHPDWARVDRDGNPTEARVCPRSGYLTELLIPQLIEVIDEYDVDGFWIDGDVWAAAPCYCPRCRAAFAADRTAGNAEPPRSEDESSWGDWLAFQRRSYESYVRTYVAAVHRRKRDCLVCVNWLYSMRHPSPPTIPVDFLSGDFSYNWGVSSAMAEARILDSRGLPWDLMAWGFTSGEERRGGWTFKTAAHLCQEAAEVLANGGAVSVYVHPPRSGHLVRWEHEVLAEVARFCRERLDVSLGSTSVPQAVVLHSETHFYRATTPLYGLGVANQPMEGALHALLDSGCHVDVKSEHDLREQIGRYGLVVVPEQDPVSDEMAAALTRYVERGGNLVLSGSHVARHAVLAGLAGVEPSGDVRDGYHYLPVDGAAVTVTGPWQPVALRGADGWAALQHGPEPGKHDAGTAAITVRRVGLGQVAAVHGPIFRAYNRTHYPRLRSLARALFARVWSGRVAEVLSSGHVVHTVRRQPGRTVVHLLNRGADPAPSPRNVMVERIPQVGSVMVRLQVPTRPATVRLVPPGQTPVEWTWESGTLIAGVQLEDAHVALVVEDG